MAEQDMRCEASACLHRGQVIEAKTTLRLDPDELSKILTSSATGRQLLQLAGAPRCGVGVVYYRYRTVGGAGEPTSSSGALLLPRGSRECTHGRRLLLYAHGTTTYKNFNLADLTQRDPANTDGAIEGLSVAALYAAQGYIVVASNYAGYKGSTLPYHPYLNAEQQSADVIDSWRAARTIIGQARPASQAANDAELFVTGYSQGGFVALATHRALQAEGVRVTASAPGSGPYAIAAMADAVIEGEVDLGSTVFTTLSVTSYQRAYGNVYRSPEEVFERMYAPGSEDLLPTKLSLDTLVRKGRLPGDHLFSAQPHAPQYAGLTPPTAPPQVPSALTALFALGFGNANLVRNTYRLALLQDAFANPDGAFPASSASMAPAAHPAQPLREAFRRNDLRNWIPRAPVQLCGGQADPTVFFFNARIQQAYWQNAGVMPGLTSVLDVDSPVSGGNDPYARIKDGFAQAKASVAAKAVAAGAQDGGSITVLEAYHGDLVAPFCLLAARAFFARF
ncbi:alpha/beta hydrolase [Caballeronia grimmiae]